MTFRNLKHAASLLEAKGFTKDHPLVLSAPAVYHCWYDARHYAEEITSTPIVSLWQENGCVHAETAEGSVTQIRKAVSVDINTAYNDTETPDENEILGIIGSNILNPSQIESMKARLDAIFNGIADTKGMNISHTESMDGTTFPSILEVAGGTAGKDDYDNCRFLAFNGRILSGLLKYASDEAIHSYILTNSDTVFTNLMVEAEHDAL